MITHQDLQSLVNAALKTGFNLNVSSLKLLVWPKGINTHIPKPLPSGYSSVYIFKFRRKYLKVGKVNQKAKGRYQYHHYAPESSRSNLSKSILNDIEMMPIIGAIPPGLWIKENTTRFNILIPNSLGKNFVHFAEAFFILKCNPKYEDTRL